MSTASTEQRQPVRYIKPSFHAGIGPLTACNGQMQTVAAQALLRIESNWEFYASLNKPWVADCAIDIYSCAALHIACDSHVKPVWDIDAGTFVYSHLHTLVIDLYHHITTANRDVIGFANNPDFLYSYTHDQRMEYRQEMLYYFWMANQEM